MDLQNVCVCVCVNLPDMQQVWREKTLETINYIDNRLNAASEIISLPAHTLSLCL